MAAPSVRGELLPAVTVPVVVPASGATSGTLDITDDGRIFFSEATVRFEMHEWATDGLEARGNGRIIDELEQLFRGAGWHVIKVESVEEASTKTIEQSREQIVDALTGRKARNLAYDKAEKFYEGCFEKDDLIKKI